MAVFQGGHHLVWKTKGYPTTSPVFEFNYCEWRLDFNYSCSAYELEMVSVGKPYRFRPFQVTCFSRFGKARNRLKFRKTECKFVSSFLIWSAKNDTVSTNWAEGSSTTKFEFVVIFHGEVGSTFAISADECTGILEPDLETLSSDFGDLLTSGNSSDVQLKCGNVHRTVHRSVLAARSEVFSAMFRNEMSKRVSGVLEINDFDEKVLDLFLKYVYTGRVDIPEDELQKLYSMADKYALHSLKQLCRDSIIGSMRGENFHEVLAFVDKSSDVVLKDAAIAYTVDHHPKWLNSENWFQFSKEHLALANEIYKTVYAKMNSDKNTDIDSDSH